MKHRFAPVGIFRGRAKCVECQRPGLLVQRSGDYHWRHLTDRRVPAILVMEAGRSGRKKE